MTEKFERKMARMKRATAKRIFTVYMTPCGGVGEPKKVEVITYTRELACSLANQETGGYIATAVRTKKVLV